MSLSPDLGAYEIKGDGPTREVTGICAGCAGDVCGADRYVIRYHPNKPGGIFHRACEPKGPGWYSLDSVETPDVA